MAEQSVLFRPFQVAVRGRRLCVPASAASVVLLVLLVLAASLLYVRSTPASETQSQAAEAMHRDLDAASEVGLYFLRSTSSLSQSAIRGREQQRIDANGGAQSAGGTSGNKINGISETNPKRQDYFDEADREFNR